MFLVLTYVVQAYHPRIVPAFPLSLMRLKPFQLVHIALFKPRFQVLHYKQA